jgi:DNA-directed RNA polymerase specialized sigma24 family protein
VKNSPSQLGFPTTWESRLFAVLSDYESLHRNSIPPEELRFQVLDRLHRFCSLVAVRDEEHLLAIMQAAIHQVIVNHLRNERRRHDRDLIAATLYGGSETAELTDWVVDCWEQILGPDSPLTAQEQEILRTALNEPKSYLGRDGINQTALAGRLGVHQTTVRSRWLRIREKLVAWRAENHPPEGPRL